MIILSRNIVCEVVVRRELLRRHLHLLLEQICRIDMVPSGSADRTIPSRATIQNRLWRVLLLRRSSDTGVVELLRDVFDITKQLLDQVLSRLILIKIWSNLVLRKLVVRRSYQLLREVLKILDRVDLCKILLRVRHWLDLMMRSIRKLALRTEWSWHLKLTIELVPICLVRLEIRVVTIILLRLVISVSVISILEVLVPIVCLSDVSVILRSVNDFSSLLVLRIIGVPNSDALTTSREPKLACWAHGHLGWFFSVIIYKCDFLPIGHFIISLDCTYLFLSLAILTSMNPSKQEKISDSSSFSMVWGISQT